MNKRTEFKNLLNSVVISIFENVNENEMLLSDVKVALRASSQLVELNRVYKEIPGVYSYWTFIDFDDRFKSNMKSLSNFEIEVREVEGKKKRVLVRK